MDDKDDKKKSVVHDKDNVSREDYQPTSRERVAVKQEFSEHKVFYQIESKDLDKLLDKAAKVKVGKESFIFEQEYTTDDVYFLLAGEGQMIIDDNIRKILKPNDVFGDWAVINKNGRPSSVYAIQDMECLIFESKYVLKALKKAKHKEFPEAFNFLKKTNFAELSDNQYKYLAKDISLIKYKPEEEIVRQGDSADAFFLIKKGHVQVLVNGQKVAELQQGKFFGESSLREKGSKRLASIVASGECLLYSITRDNMKAFGGDLTTLINRNEQRRLFKGDKVLQHLLEF